jgi:cell shape-determining protein MreC
METDTSQTTGKNQVLEAFKVVGKLFTTVLIGIFRYTKEVQRFIKRINEQSKTIETIEQQNAEIERLKQKIESIEVESTKLEILNNKIYECQCNIVLLQRGRKVLKLKSS